MRPFDYERESQLAGLFVLSVRTTATAIRGEGFSVEWLIFPRKCRFLSFLLRAPLPFPASVSLERIIPRYESGIYNYTGAVIGFPPFFSAPFFLFSLPFFLETPRAIPRSAFISESRLIRGGQRLDRKVPNYSSRSPERIRPLRCPAEGKSESSTVLL